MDQQPTVRIRSPVILETMVPLNRTAALWQSKVTPLPTISPSPRSDMECHVWRDLWLGAEVGTGEVGDTGDTLDTPDTAHFVTSV
ncbi:hypothetical protein V500_08606 [Pseudogymnoascus sp. VKM F-4518 (FW-2643)]|nr:hypothetical protein V500_08606 [Pseudogymnoascus sp. VKM F-4518 (FW-2643)]